MSPATADRLLKRARERSRPHGLSTTKPVTLLKHSIQIRTLAQWDDAHKRYCEQHQITFTRSRPYRKNDQAYIEQKNWTAIRQVIGYDRFEGESASAALEVLYQPLRLDINFFQPAKVLVSRQRDGAKVRRRYDHAKTPDQRVRGIAVAPLIRILLRLAPFPAAERTTCSISTGKERRRCVLTNVKVKRPVLE